MKLKIKQQNPEGKPISEEEKKRGSSSQKMSNCMTPPLQTLQDSPKSKENSSQNILINNLNLDKIDEVLHNMNNANDTMNDFANSNEEHVNLSNSNRITINNLPSNLPLILKNASNEESIDIGLMVRSGPIIPVVSKRKSLRNDDLVDPSNNFLMKMLEMKAQSIDSTSSMSVEVFAEDVNNCLGEIDPDFKENNKRPSGNKESFLKIQDRSGLDDLEHEESVSKNKGEESESRENNKEEEGLSPIVKQEEGEKEKKIQKRNEEKIQRKIQEKIEEKNDEKIQEKIQEIIQKKVIEKYIEKIQEKNTEKLHPLSEEKKKKRFI